MANTASSSTQKSDWREQVEWPLHKTNVAKVYERVVKLIFPLLFNFEIIGQENVPQSGACILAPNHISNYDPFLAGLATQPRQAFFMGKEEIFRIPFVSWISRHYGSFPVYRGTRDEWAIRHANRVLEAGNILCMFPEGTRSKNNAKLGKGKTGTVKLALEHQVPIIPAAIINSHLAKPGKRSIKMAIHLSPAIDVVALADPPPHEYSKIRELTAYLMQQIAAMLPPDKRGYYA